MAKRAKSRRVAPQREVTDAKLYEQNTEPEGDTPRLKCEFCDSALDLTRITETKCWLCGSARFVDITERDLINRQKRLARKEKCCPNSNCERALLPIANTEEFCSGCGTSLEKASPALSFQVAINRQLRSSSPRSYEDRLFLIQMGRQLGIPLGEAIAAVTRALEPPRQYPSEIPVERTPEAALSMPSDLALEEEADVWTYEDGNHRLRHLEQKMRFRYQVLIGGVLLALVFVLLMGWLSRRTVANLNQNEPPTAASPSAIALNTPTPFKESPGMVWVPGGKFNMGRDRRDGGDEYESPSHEVELKPYYMDQMEVTRQAYQQCVAAGQCRVPYGWSGGTYPAKTGNWPVTGVSWDDANEYAKFVGKRLPTEEEWEFAATGGKGSRYPWGELWLDQHAQVGKRSLTDVGQYASYFGLFDVIGNAAEWTSSEWKQYPEKQSYFQSPERVELLRVIRGGSYRSSPAQATVTYRNAQGRNDGAREHFYEQTGFRCVQDVDEP